jgi:hypothetical protein
MYSSTCFERPHAHHQELNNCSSSHWFYHWSVVVAVLLVVVGPVKLLKPTGYVMHHKFKIQQLYTLPILYLYVLYLSENKQRLVPLTA